MNRMTHQTLLEEFRDVCADGGIPAYSKLFKIRKYIETGVFKIKKPGFPFFCVCSEGHIDIILYFIEKSPKEYKNLHLKKAVEYACLLGHIELLEYFIEQKVPLQYFKTSMSDSVKKWWVLQKLKGI